MRSFQDTFESLKQSFITTFLICMTVPLKEVSAGQPFDFPSEFL